MTIGALDAYPDEIEEIYKTTRERVGTNLNRLVNSMPTYGSSTGNWEMTSLQNLAPFSPDAAALLQRQDIFVEQDTLRSAAQSIAAEEHVPSGLTHDGYYPPRSKTYVYGWVIVIVLMSCIIIPVGATFAPCPPACPIWYTSFWSQFFWVLRFTLIIGLAVSAAAFVPGWLKLRHDRARQDKRRHR